MNKKVMFIPGLVLDDFILNRDISMALEKRGFDIVIFEENLNYAREHMLEFEKTIGDYSPDIVLGYGGNFFNLSKKSGMASSSIFELKKIPYISLNFTGVFGFLSWHKSSFRIASKMKGVGFSCPAYADLAGNFGVKDPFVLPLSIGDFASELRVSQDKKGEGVLVWQSSAPPEIDGVYSGELKDCFERVVSLPEISLEGARAMLPDEIKNTIIWSKFLDDVVKYVFLERADKFREYIKRKDIKGDEINVGLPNLKLLKDLVSSVNLVLHLPSPFNDLGWDSVYWQIWRVGGVTILPKKGLWKGLELAVDENDPKQMEEAIDILISDDARRQRYREEVWDIINRELIWEKNISLLIDVIEGVR